MRIFRKLRITSLASKKVKDYFKYALGEIILVSVGILLAVYVNNWNNQRNTERVKQELLSDIAIELQLNIDRLYELDTATWQSMIEADSIAKAHMELMNKPLSEENLPQLINNFHYRYNDLALLSTAYENLKASGVMNTLEPEIKDGINRYYKLMEKERNYCAEHVVTMEKAKDRCIYGFQLLIRDYRVDSSTYISKNPWIHDYRSTHYMDLYNYLEVRELLTRIIHNRQNTIIDESQKLKELLTTPKPK